MQYTKTLKMNLGTSVVTETSPVVVKSDDDEVAGLIGTPWFNAYIKERYDIDLNQTSEEIPNANAILDTGIVSEHAVLFGGPGGGKTTLAYKILHDQLRAGASAIVFDSKMLTIQEGIEVARLAGLRPEQITMVYPEDKLRGIPGWNPLACTPDRLKENASEFLDLILNGEEPGVTIGQPIRFGAMIMSALGLSIQELVWFFTDFRYREGLLVVAEQNKHSHLLVDAIEYFRGVFKTSRGEQPYDPVLNKITKFIDNNDYIKALFTAQFDTLNLPDLWFNQRLILVFLSMPEPENRLLSQMLARSLYRISLRPRAWERPVVMMVDEIARLQDSIKDIIIRTQQIGRAQGLWVLGATQDPNLLQADLKQSLTGNLMAMKVYFRMDARDAASLARDVIDIERGSKVTRIVIDVAQRDRTNGTEMTYEDTPILYVLGDTPSCLTIKQDVLDDINSEIDSEDRFNRLLHWLNNANIGLFTLRVEQNNEQYFLDDYLEMSEDWELVSPHNVSVRISFPKPKIIERVNESENERVQKAAAMLQQTPRRHAFIWTKERSYGLVRLVNFDLSRAKAIRIDEYLGGHQNGFRVDATARMRNDARRIVLDSLPKPEVRQVQQRTPDAPRPQQPAQAPKRQQLIKPVKKKIFDDEGI